MKVAAIVKVSLYKTMRLPPKVQACPRQNGRYGRLPGGPRLKRPVRARSPAASEQNGRYVRGPRRAPKPRPIRLRFSAAPKKRPIRLRFSAGPKKTADTFTVFSEAQRSGRYVYGFWRGQKKRPTRLRFLAQVPPLTSPIPAVLDRGPPGSRLYRPFSTEGHQEVARTGRFVRGTPVL